MGDSGQADLERVGAYISSVFIFGWMFGGFAFGFLCDRVGRKKSVILSTACLGLFTLLTAVAPGWMWIIACRFFSGFGVGGVLVTTAIIISETWNEKNKAIALGILSIAFPIGIFSSGLIDYFIITWRQAFYVGLIPVLLAFLSVGLLREPESAVQVRNEKSKGLLFAKEIRRNLLVGCLVFGTMLIGLWAVMSWLPTWIHSLTGGSDTHKERGISMMLFAAGGLTGGLGSGWISNAIGVRKTMMICFAGCFIFSFLLFKLQTTITIFTYAEIVCIALFIGISQGALNVYIPELFPSGVRGTATGFCFNIGRLFTALAVFFVGTMVNFAGGYGNAIFLFSFIFLAGFILMGWTKENKFSTT